ncbi:uncharacterized protein LOC116257112 [Nymphaea colorata]|nr:uncharacterized protein LOC116257112 [Nymphaea colorata]
MGSRFWTQELRPEHQRNKPEVSRPRVSDQGLSTPREVAPSEEEKKIMPHTEEFEAMVDAVINHNADVASNKRRLPIFVALTDPTQREFWLKGASEPSREH